jgi:hypothetical protein
MQIKQGVGIGQINFGYGVPEVHQVVKSVSRREDEH